MDCCLDCLLYSSEANFTRSTHELNLWYVFGDYTFEMTTTSPRDQRVKQIVNMGCITLCSDIIYVSWHVKSCAAQLFVQAKEQENGTLYHWSFVCKIQWWLLAFPHKGHVHGYWNLIHWRISQLLLLYNLAPSSMILFWHNVCHLIWLWSLWALEGLACMHNWGWRY